MGTNRFLYNSCLLSLTTRFVSEQHGRDGDQEWAACPRGLQVGTVRLTNALLREQVVASKGWVVEQPTTQPK